MVASEFLVRRIGQKPYVWGIKFTPLEICRAGISNGVDYYRLKTIAIEVMDASLPAGRQGFNAGLAGKCPAVPSLVGGVKGHN